MNTLTTVLSFALIIALYIISLLLDRVGMLPLHQGLAWLVCAPSAVFLVAHIVTTENVDEHHVDK